MPLVTVRLGTNAHLTALLAVMVRICAEQVRSRRVPALYQSGVRYAREPVGSERWQSAVETYARRRGDCEDLAAWRAGELVAAGESARAVVVSVSPGMRHCVVVRADGRIEDPSRRLGMRGRA